MLPLTFISKQKMTDWNNCRNILCIRPDNMGDLLMSGPAIHALKKSFDARITVLTSSMAAGIAAFMPGIDEVMVFDLPWVKSERPADNTSLEQMVAGLREKKFDAAVIFTVFSQNPLPAALLAYQAGIPAILAYCRENPYGLLTHWVPDEEPYTLIRHQVERDIHLIAATGAKVDDKGLKLNVPSSLWPSVQTRLAGVGWNSNRPWLLLHAGVSEAKRQYPAERWIDAGRTLTAKGYQLVLTGTTAERRLTSSICEGIGTGCFNLAGSLALDELICLISESPLLISVNTGPVHIAAATATPVVVLYAQTNSQHTPWQVPNKVLEFPVKQSLQSKNEVLRYLQQTIYHVPAAMPGVNDIVEAVESLLKQSAASVLPSP